MKQKIAVVTGSSRGIGKAIVQKLAAHGYLAIITYFKHLNAGKETVEEIKSHGGKAILVHLDVRSQKSVKAVFTMIGQRFGYLNVLVNNAGIEIAKTIEKVNLAEWKRVIDTKINGNFLCTKYALPLLKNQTNANLIITVSSLGERPDPNYPAYCTGTAGIIAFLKMTAQELGKYNIRVNGIAPGTTHTDMWQEMGGDNKAMWVKFAQNNPLKRVSTPEDIANVTLMLINDRSQYLNGNIIYVNGGSHLK